MQGWRTREAIPSFGRINQNTFMLTQSGIRFVTLLLLNCCRSKSWITDLGLRFMLAVIIGAIVAGANVVHSLNYLT